MNPEMVSLLGGSALLFYSVEELSKSVQVLAGSKFRVWINLFARNRFLGVVLGIVLSILLTSSGAVTVMLVGLANSRLLSLEQVFSVSLGAAIGTTFIVHLFAFNISDYGLLMVAFGVFLDAVSSFERVSKLAKIFFYLGILFFSLQMIIAAGKTLEQNHLFQFLIHYLAQHPFFSFSIATLLTALTFSSAATIAFIMSLMVVKHGSLNEALPWILGANLGTSSTAFLASFRSGVLGKQAALGNLLIKIAGVSLVFPFRDSLASLVMGWGGDVGRQIAITHTLFNVMLAVLFFPFIPWGVSLVRKMVPNRRDNDPFFYQYLDSRTIETPELALAQAQREILRLSDIVEQMVEKSVHLFNTASDKEIDGVKAMDKVADFLNKGIKLYLAKLSQKEMAPEQVSKEFELFLRTNDLENIGDIVDKNILWLVKKNRMKGYEFSKEGWNEIVQFHTRVVDCVRLSTAYFNSRNPALLSKLTISHQQIANSTLDLTEQHIYRLHKGVKASLDTTSVHLDLIGNLQRIADLAVNFTRLSVSRPSTDDVEPKLA